MDSKLNEKTEQMEKSKMAGKWQNETNANYVIDDETLKFLLNSLHLFYN